jgi:exodeoxyribonuclease V alpha subunit
VRLASDRSLNGDLALTEGVNSPKARALFETLDRSRVLTVVRQGPFGVQGVNDLLVMKRFGGRMPVNPLEKPGVPVIVTRNTPARNLWNGDVGVTVEGPSGMVVLFPRGDKVVSCPVGLLPEHELAYAMTVHKSQGSEFENVLVVLPDDEKHPLLNRQVVYTGITRAKKRAVIAGTDAALATALSRKLERDTGLVIVGHKVL